MNGALELYVYAHRYGSGEVEVYAGKARSHLTPGQVRDLADKLLTAANYADGISRTIGPDILGSRS
jgi:hypothetical protein